MALHQIQPLKCYSQQSPFTNPGQYSYLFKNLPKSIRELVEIIQGVMIHSEAIELYGLKGLTNDQKEDRESVCC